MYSAVLTFDGHILDSLLLPKVLDLIISAGAEYEIEQISIGRTKLDQSSARIKVTATDEGVLQEILKEAQAHGAVVVEK